jgi:hypothetical protein
MVRRIARIRFDARSDQPWRREGFRHPDLMIWVRANRARLVAACLTLCQAWASAGRPPAARSLGSFETWSQTLGGILHVAGVPGFLGNLDEVMEASDSEGGSWRAFIQLWWDRFGSAEVSVSDLIGFAKDAEASMPISAKNDHGLKVALGEAEHEPSRECVPGRSAERGKCCLGRLVQNPQQRFGRARRQALTLFPIAHRIDRHTKPGGEISLRQPGTPTHAPRIQRGILRPCGIILSRLAPQISLCRGIYPAGVNTPRDRLAGFKLHANRPHSETPPLHLPCGRK